MGDGNIQIDSIARVINLLESDAVNLRERERNQLVARDRRDRALPLQTVRKQFDATSAEFNKVGQYGEVRER